MERDPRAENELDEALSALLGDSAAPRDPIGGQTPPQPPDPELRRLLAVAQEVRDALSVTPSLAAQQHHLQRLAEEAAKPDGGAVRALKPTRRRLPRFLLRPATVLAAASLAAAPTAVAFAAQDAQPGTVLYGTKLAIESIRLVVELDPAEDTRLHLRFAEERIDELAKLAAAGKDGPEVDAALANLSSHQENAAKQVKTLEAKGEAPPSLEGRVMKVLMRNVVALETLSSQWECVVNDAASPNLSCSVLAETRKSTQQSIQTVDDQQEPEKKPEEPSSPQPTVTPTPEPSPNPSPSPNPGKSQRPAAYSEDDSPSQTPPRRRRSRPRPRPSPNPNDSLHSSERSRA